MDIEEDEWIIVCESPYEIEYYIDGDCIGTATGYGAEIIMQIQNKQKKKK